MTSSPGHGRRAPTATAADVDGSPEQTPLEQLAAAATHLNASVAADLVERIRQQAPEFLEKAVLQLLVAMGYGGSDEAAHTWEGRVTAASTV